MEWIASISQAISYIEEQITQDISIEKIANQVNISPFYFQKGFSFLCGFTVMEYIRNRKLALAGSELVSTNAKVVDLALKYGYDSPDSFTKAFTRFHGVTPTMVRKDSASLRSFAPLKIKLSLEGGYFMDYKIIQKDSFTVVGSKGSFKYEDAKDAIPKFWADHYAAGKGELVCGMYGINYDEAMDGKTFDYILADNYNPALEIPESLVTQVIPAFTWAVFHIKGAMPQALQEVNVKIFSQWLPECKDYEIAAGYCVEMYDIPDKYPLGTKDENYYCEMWIPVKKKG